MGAGAGVETAGWVAAWGAEPLNARSAAAKKVAASLLSGAMARTALAASRTASQSYLETEASASSRRMSIRLCIRSLAIMRE